MYISYTRFWSKIFFLSNELPLWLDKNGHPWICVYVSNSPVHVLLVQHEPALSFWQKHVHILVNWPNCENLVIMPHWLASKEFFRFFQSTIHALNLTRLRIQQETVGNPAIISAKDQNFRLVQWERTNGVPCHPEAFFVCNCDWLPLSFFKVSATVKSFEGVKRLVFVRVATADHIQVAIVKHANRMEMSSRVQFSNLGPLVLGNLIHFTLFGDLLGIFGSSCKQKVLCFELGPPLQVRQLMTRSSIFHASSAFNLQRLFVENEAVVSKHVPNLVLLLFAANNEHLVQHQDGVEVARQNTGIRYLHALWSLLGQVVEVHRGCVLIVVVQSWARLWKDEVWFEGDHIWQERPKFIDFGADYNFRPRILLQIYLVIRNFLLKLFGAIFELGQCRTQFEHIKELLLLGEASLLAQVLLNLAYVLLHGGDGILGEVFGRRCVLLDRVEMFDGVERFFALFIHDLLQDVVLLLHLVNYFLLNWTQTVDVEFHFRARFERTLSRFKDLLKLVNLIESGLFEGHTATANHVIFKVAVVAQSDVVVFTVCEQLISMVTHANLFLLNWFLSSVLRLLLHLVRILRIPILWRFYHNFFCFLY